MFYNPRHVNFRGISASSPSARSTRSGRRLTLIALLGAVTLTLGALTLFVRLVPSMGSTSFVHASVPAASGLALAGALLVYFSVVALARLPEERFRILPLTLTMTLIVSLISLCQFEWQRETSYLNDRVTDETVRVKQEIFETLRQTALAMERFASRIEYLGTGDRNYLKLDSQAYLNNIPILKRIGITDAQFRVRWAYPSEIAPQVLGFQQGNDPVRLEAFAEAKRSRHPSLSRALELRSGGLGFILPVALYPGEKFAGIVYATVEADKLFHGYVASKDFQITIREPGHTLFQSASVDAANAEFRQSKTLDWGATHWMIDVVPARNFISRERSTTPFLILIFGGLASLAIGVFLEEYFRSRRNALANAENAKALNSRLGVALEWQKIILDASDYSIISTDARGIIQTFNSASSKMFGYDPSEVVGKKTPGIFHVREEIIARAETLTRELGRTVEPGFDAFTAKARALKCADENEWTFVRKDGSRFPVSLSLTVLYDAAGEISGYLGITIDQTEKKKTQMDLFISNERLLRVIEATGEGIWERDYDAQKGVTYVDDQAKKIFGLSNSPNSSYDEVIAKIDPSELDGIAEAVRRHVEGHTPGFDLEFKVIDSPGQFRWVHSRGRVVFEIGKTPRLISTVRDVTDEVERKNQLWSALQAAEEATRAKAEFLANMSHEIRTPLNGVIGMADLLMETPLLEEQKNFARIVQQSGTTLLLLVNDILDFSKIEAGKLDLERTRFSLTQAVEGQADILAAKAREKGLSLMTYISPDIPAEVFGDPGRLGQILLNLTGNAIKFSSAGGVSIRVEAHAGEGDPAGTRRIRFEIEDSGIGMTPGTIERLFRPFVQGEGSTARKYGGTGLGLSICKRLVDLMRGGIGVESSIGLGSKFWFELPFEVADSSVKMHPPLKAPSDMKVLLVDDDPIAVDVVHRYLFSWGVRELIVADFKEVPAVLSQAIDQGEPFALALVGHGMKSDAGLQLSAELKRSLGAKAPRTILMNQFGHKVTDPDLFTQVIAKPLKQSVLWDAIVNALNENFTPAQPKSAPRQGTDAGSAPLKARILVADDNLVNQLVVLKMLEKFGYSGHAVANGREVLEALDRVEYDLVLMDCQMPEMDGYEATRTIRELADAAKKSIPIIALTANAMPGDEKLCLDSGMDDYLIKPIKKEALAAKIEKWLARTSRKSPAAA